MIHAKNYETVPVFVKTTQKNCGLFFSGHGADQYEKSHNTLTEFTRAMLSQGPPRDAQ